MSNPKRIGLKERPRRTPAARELSQRNSPYNLQVGAAELGGVIQKYGGAREGECELGTLAIGETVSGTDFGDRMGRGSGQFAESALDTLYVACNRG
jgi:hypothetical protein